MLTNEYIVKWYFKIIRMIFKRLLITLFQIVKVLDQIQQKLEETMATLQNFKDLLAAVDVETNRIADKIAALVAQLESGSLTEAEETEVLAGLTAAADRLKTIGHDPQNPIPPIA